MSVELEKRVERHEYEIETLKGGISDVTTAVRDAVQSMDRLANSFSVYATKHDNIESTVNEMRLAQIRAAEIMVKHGEDIAEIKPVAQALRGFIWKLASVAIGGAGLGGGAAAVVASMIK